MSVRQSMHISPVFPPSPQMRVESLISKVPFDSQARIPVILIGMPVRILNRVEYPDSDFLKNIFERGASLGTHWTAKAAISHNLSDYFLFFFLKNDHYYKKKSQNIGHFCRKG